jgi:micrococcal nuclease
MRIKICFAPRRKDAKVFLGILLSCLLFFVGCQGYHDQTANNRTQVRVSRVVSGQTLEVLGMAEQPNLISPVRLLGLDAPDLRQNPWGYESRAALARLIGDQEKSVTLEFDVQAKDNFGRILAYVWKDDQLLNEELLKQGYALFVSRSPNHKYDQRLERAQQWARLMEKGIWNPEKPLRVPPAEFRRRNF